MRSLKLLALFFVLHSMSVNAQELSAPLSDSLKVYEDASVELKPSFPGGEKKLKLYIKKNYQLPGSYETNDLGNMHLTFIIEPDGRITNFQGLEGSMALQNSIQNFLLNGQRWQPGLYGNVAVRTRYTLPFSFVLSSTSKKSTARQPFGGKKKVKKKKIFGIQQG
jgi:hypothetical protein